MLFNANWNSFRISFPFLYNRRKFKNHLLHCLDTDQRTETDPFLLPRKDYQWKQKISDGKPGNFRKTREKERTVFPVWERRKRDVVDRSRRKMSTSWCTCSCWPPFGIVWSVPKHGPRAWPPPRSRSERDQTCRRSRFFFRSFSFPRRPPFRVCLLVCLLTRIIRAVSRNRRSSLSISSRAEERRIMISRNFVSPLFCNNVSRDLYWTTLFQSRRSN